ncbi:RodZ domain-containing protein [Marichromatium bheemlicum]|uniref:Helix-turn-helix domain-containing protein n=1 Tax=Marichromatium bheemlicum TaxID=365339 RepID=A0ABX1I655_9GAMM|nr:RodZ domain-containing protein [Marichromatium bheemlicum]NKN31885.1 helix-turn-helix domain-containing protein [Marichromatium bheemlicum]
MSEIRSPSPEAPSTPDTVMHPGQRLRQQREARGLEITRVASQLHLRPETIEALEQDRYDQLPGPVFAIGYLRNYARLLGVDPTPLIEAARAAPQQQKTLPTRSRPQRNLAEATSRWMMRLISLALVAAAIGMLALWWQSRPELTPEPIAEQTDEPPQSAPRTPPQQTAVTPSTPGPAPVTAPPAAPAQPMSAAPQAEPRPTPAPVPTVPVQPAPLEPVPRSTALPRTLATAESAPVDTETPPEVVIESPTSPAAPPEVALEFTGNCWIEVRDVNRRIILTGELRAGDRRVLEGEPPYRFIIGNTAMARLTIDGEPFDLDARARGNVARFTLDPSQPD